MHRNRRYWSVARIYCFAVGALWLLGPALLIANIIDHGADHHTLMPAVGIGGTFLLGMLMVALKFWPRPLDPPERPYRRPAMVGGRPFGEGLDVAVGRVRTERAPTPRVPFLPDSPTAMLPPVVGPSAVRTAPLAHPVALAEPEEMDEPGEFSEHEFRAWADGKREGVREGRERALEELGLGEEGEGPAS